MIHAFDLLRRAIQARTDMQPIDERATKVFMKPWISPRHGREEARTALPADAFAMSGHCLWTIGFAMLVFQVVVVVGFATVGLSLMLRPTV